MVVVFFRSSSYSEGWRRKSWKVRLAWTTQQDKRNQEKKKGQKGWAWLTPQPSSGLRDKPRKTLKEKQFTLDSFRALEREVGSNVPTVVRAWGHCSVAGPMLRGPSQDQQEKQQLLEKTSQDQEGQFWALPQIQSAHIRETDRSNGHMAMAMSS